MDVVTLMDVVIPGVEEVKADTFLEIDECIELQGIFDITGSPEQACPATEYLHGDNELLICGDMDGDHYYNDFFAELHQLPFTEEESEDDQELDIEPIKI